MKKIFFTFLLLISALSIHATNLDSLYQIIADPDYSDSLKLEAYEVITKKLLREDRDSCRVVCAEGLKFSQELGNKRFIWSFHNRTGISYYYDGKFETAIKYWFDALAIAEEANDDFIISQTLNNIAGIYNNTDRYEEAIKYYQKALQIKIKDKETSLLSICMVESNIALLYGKLGDFDKTDSIFNQILQKVDNIDKHTEKYKVYVNIGVNYSFLGSNLDKKKMYYEALKYFFLAEAEINNTENQLDKITVLLNIGETYLQINDEENGLKNMWKAKIIAEEIESYEKLETIYQVLKNHYYNIGNYKLAYDAYDSMLLYKESIYNIEIQNAISEIQAKYDTEKKERENLKLQQQLLEEELQNQKQKRTNNIYILLIIAFVLFGIVISHFSLRLKGKNQLLVKSKKDLEETNSSLNISKKQTEKALEFKSLFLANMSHEIRTPLNIIIGFNSILKKNINDDKLNQYLESIEKSSYNLLRFLNDILDMSKIEAGKVLLSPEDINLKLLVMNIKELFMLKANEKDLALEFEFDPKIPQEIVIDEIRMRQVLVNLIGNAIKFTEQGSVKIKVEVVVLNQYQSEFPTTTNLRFIIEDTGIGIAEDDLEKIFESFRQVNIKEQKQLGGTGLGLAISKRLIEMMGGKLTVSSQKGKGSSFSVLLPNVPISSNVTQANRSKRTFHSNDNLEFTSGTILVADDEEMNRSLIKVCFEQTKVEVLEASNGEEVIEIARKTKPEIILMDIKMPIMDGIEASKIIKADTNLKHISIIAFSASNIFDRLNQDEIELFSGLIPKPVLLDELYQKTAELLPHKVKNYPNSNQKDKHTFIIEFTDNYTETSQEAIDTLTNEIHQKWIIVSTSNSMNEILEFTNDLEVFADKYNLKGLKKYAFKIREAGNNFDIDQIKSLLEVFPQISPITNN